MIVDRFSQFHRICPTVFDVISAGKCVLDIEPDLAERHLKRDCNLMSDPDADLHFSPLYGTDISSMNACDIRESFLRKPQLLPIAAYCMPKHNFDFSVHNGLASLHAVDYATDDLSTDDRLHSVESILTLLGEN